MNPQITCDIFIEIHYDIIKFSPGLEHSAMSGMIEERRNEREVRGEGLNSQMRVTYVRFNASNVYSSIIIIIQSLCMSHCTMRMHEFSIR